LLKGSQYALREILGSSPRMMGWMAP
jgi:hypothetical protein